ncbi:hypothetical protein [Magnetococcus marinus]|uniref:hypothetical protein n=1 Tax=Magnetococcus marinus TaxID=1124597 RepID=UPI00117E6CD3|nr:hypothetical protein [Magnetococcus marinus]
MDWVDDWEAYLVGVPGTYTLLDWVDDWEAYLEVGSRREEQNGVGVPGTYTLLDWVDDWEAYLEAGSRREEQMLIQLRERTGRPMGSEAFTKRLEQQTVQKLGKQKLGPKSKKSVDHE